jgi:antitoxin FitA
LGSIDVPPKRIHIAAMPVTLTIKNVPEPVAEALRQRAAANHRSLNGELLALVTREVKAPYDNGLDALRAEIQKLGLKTPSESAAMVREDRDTR